jgi:hypothetical protein
VSALRAVEQVHLLLLLGSSSAHVALVGVRLGVHDASRLAESRDAGTMPEADLERSCQNYRITQECEIGSQHTKKVLAAVIRT